MQRSGLAVLAGLALIVGAADRAAAQQAGVAGAVRGQVEITEQAGAAGRAARSGELVYPGNTIRSGAESGLQILLLDGTSFLIGPDSEFTVDTFAFDPQTDSGKIAVSVTKGVFRFVAGKIVQQQPGNMVVKMPTGAIEVRGTMAAGRVDQVDQGGKNVLRQQVVLLGPGAQTEGRNRRGGLVLTGNGPSTEIRRAGFGSESTGGNPWGAAQPLLYSTIAEIMARLRAAHQAEGQVPSPFLPPNNPMSALAEAQADALKQRAALLLALSIIASTQNMADVAATWGSQSQQESNLKNLAQGGQRAVPDGQPTFEQLRGPATGQSYWTQTGVPFDGFGSRYNLSLNIDFGARSVGGGASRIDILNSQPGSVALPTQSFANLSGPAQFNFLGLGGYFNSIICDTACQVNLRAIPLNAGGVLAKTLNHTVTISENGAVLTTGTGTTGARIPGQAP